MNVENIVTSMFSTVSHKRFGMERDAGPRRQWHGHAARALRSIIKPIASRDPLSPPAQTEKLHSDFTAV